MDYFNQTIERMRLSVKVKTNNSLTISKDCFSENCVFDFSREGNEKKKKGKGQRGEKQKRKKRTKGKK